METIGLRTFNVRVPDQPHEDKDDPNAVTRRLDVRRVLTATPRDEVVDNRQGDVLER